MVCGELADLHFLQLPNCINGLIKHTQETFLKIFVSKQSSPATETCNRECKPQYSFCINRRPIHVSASKAPYKVESLVSQLLLSILAVHSSFCSYPSQITMFPLCPHWYRQTFFAAAQISELFSNCRPGLTPSALTGQLVLSKNNLCPDKDFFSTLVFSICFSFLRGVVTIFPPLCRASPCIH